jgi:hypothetical protein
LGGTRPVLKTAAFPFVISTGAHPDFLLRRTGYGRVCAFL